MADSKFPLVSIGIPTYNRADGSLLGAINSALEQSYANIEVIVSDNCSPDNTREVVTSIDDPRLRYYRQETNIGSNGNFNFCLDSANGDYFVLLSDDDLIDPTFVETCMEKADYSPEYVFIRTGVRKIDEHGTVRKEKPNVVGGNTRSDFFHAWFDGNTSLYLCSTLFNTKLLKETGGLHSKHDLFEDGIAIVRLLGKGKSLEIADIKASFRVHPEQRTVSVKLREWCEEFVIFLDEMDKVLESDNEMLREKGRRFFARISLQRVKRMPSKLRRFLGYVVVARYFPRRYWPASGKGV